MAFADGTKVISMLKGMDEEVESENMPLALTFADRRIKRKLRKKNVPIPTVPDPLPDDDPIQFLLDAGNYYAASFLYDANFISSDSRIHTAISWEKQGDESVGDYIEIYLDSHNDAREDVPIYTAIATPRE